MSKIKKQSKRMTCSLRYKITKKVAEHNRKLKKQKRKNPTARRRVKDPGVPRSAPFAEEVLQKAELLRAQAEEEAKKNKEAKKLRRNQKKAEKKASQKISSEVKDD